jgi:hypothetical protein
MMEFAGKKVAIFGITGSGKTFFARRLLRFFKAPMVFTVHRGEFDSPEDRCYIYVPENPLQEFEAFAQYSLNLAKAGKIDALVIDEADLFLRSNWDLSPTLNDIVVNHRHYNLALVLVSRRPQDIPTKFYEGCHYIFIFKLEGVNAVQRFREIDPRIVPLLERIEYSSHDFVVKELGEPPYVNSAIA